MEFTMFEDVVVLAELPEEGVLAGDIGVVVEKHEVPGLETAYSVEFFDMSGDTVAVVVMPASQLRRPSAADRPQARTGTGGVDSPAPAVARDIGTRNVF